MSDHLEITEYEELMELVFAYTTAAQDFGLTHKMNNRFTSLSMNASFLKQALERQDYEKAKTKAAQVSESITNLVKFSQDLLSSDSLPRDTQEIEFHSYVEEVMRKLLNLPTFKGMEITQQFSTEPASFQANLTIIRIFLYTFLKNAKRYRTNEPIVLSTSLDVEKNQAIIKTEANQIMHEAGNEPVNTSLQFPSAGEIPMRYLARVIRNISNLHEIVHKSERPLNLELRIQL